MQRHSFTPDAAGRVQEEIIEESKKASIWLVTFDPPAVFSVTPEDMQTWVSENPGKRFLMFQGVRCPAMLAVPMTFAAVPGAEPPPARFIDAFDQFREPTPPPAVESAEPDEPAEPITPVEDLEDVQPGDTGLEETNPPDSGVILTSGTVIDESDDDDEDDEELSGGDQGSQTFDLNRGVDPSDPMGTPDFDTSPGDIEETEEPD